MTKNVPLLTYYELFDKVKATLPGGDKTALSAKRQEALDYFIKQGFPKASREEWKYTRLGLFLTSPLATSTKIEITRDALSAFAIEGLSCYRIVFVNGWFDAALSDKNIPGTNTMAASPDILTTVNARDEMEALNMAFMTDGVSLCITKDTVLDKPLHVLFLTTQGAVYPRNKVLLDEGCKATLIESYVALQSPEQLPSHNVTSLTNAIMEITLKQNATLEHYKHQQESMEAAHIGTTRITMEKGSSYNSFVFAIGGNLSRNAVHVDMNGEGASCKLHGIYLGKGRQHFDHYIPVYHNAPHCFSEQKYKGVLNGAAQGIFYGKVFVPPGSQKTDAHQSNYNLLLSENAMAYSRPELEIHADDVKCSHGSATGALDKDAIFYLRSRGIGEVDARSLLVEGFARELLEGIPQQSLKHYWQGVLRLWLGIRLW